MNALLQIALSNAAVCGLMTVLLLPLARWLRRPALTHALCVLILLKLLTPPLLNVPVMGQSPVETTPPRQMMVEDAAPANRVATPSAQPADSIRQYAPSGAQDAAFEPASGASSISRIAPPRPAPQPTRTVLIEIWKNAANHWRFWLLTCWIASSVVLSTVTLARIIRLRLTVRRATLSGPDITPQVELLSKRLEIGRAPRVRFILGSPPPMLLALFCRPELVIPIRLWERLDHRQRQTLLLHELAHLRRRDHWVRYLELLATCVYWWHFATWFARRALHEAEEHCCDAWVLWAMPDSSRTYMTTLLDAVEFLSQRAHPRPAAVGALASGMGQFHNLQRRLTMVRERNVQRRLDWRGLAAVVLLSAVALPLGAKVARGNDRAAAQSSAAPAAATDVALAESDVLAAAEDPAEPAGPGPTVAPGADPQDPTGNESARPQDDVARLEAELAAARQNVQRLQKQLEIARRQSPRHTARVREASLGQIVFKYQDSGSGGTVLALGGSSRRLLWKLDVPMNADSGIRCYDNETLLIRSADGYTRLVGAWDGHVIRVWAPGVEAPSIENGTQVNPFDPFRTSAARPDAAPAPSSGAAGPSPRNEQDQEQRIERMEQSIRLLTEAVDRLAREQKDQRGSSGPALR